VSRLGRRGGDRGDDAEAWTGADRASQARAATDGAIETGADRARDQRAGRGPDELVVIRVVDRDGAGGQERRGGDSGGGLRRDGADARGHQAC